MITKKVNKSSQLIFISPNYLKLSESKPINKKSLHLVSPKASTKPSIKTIYKPLTSSKKSKEPSRHQCEEEYAPSRPLGISINSPAPVTTKIKSSNNTISKRSKSKLTANDHLSTDLWRSSVYESMNSKQGGETHRRPQSIELKWKYEDSKGKERQRVSTNKGKDHDKSKEGDQEKYQLVLGKTKSMFKKYINVIFKLKDEVKDLKEENLFLRKKLNII